MDKSLAANAPQLEATVRVCRDRRKEQVGSAAVQLSKVGPLQLPGILFWGFERGKPGREIALLGSVQRGLVVRLNVIDADPDGGNRLPFKVEDAPSNRHVVLDKSQRQVGRRV